MTHSVLPLKSSVRMNPKPSLSANQPVVSWLGWLQFVEARLSARGLKALVVRLRKAGDSVAIGHFRQQGWKSDRLRVGHEAGCQYQSDGTRSRVVQRF